MRRLCFLIDIHFPEFKEQDTSLWFKHSCTTRHPNQKKNIVENFAGIKRHHTTAMFQQH